VIDEDEIRAGIAVWCAAHIRAGFDGSAKVVVRSEPGSPENVLTLGDTSAVAAAYLAAVGRYNYKTSKFESEEEWEVAAGAELFILDDGGRQQSAFVAFDECNGWSDRVGSEWEVAWDAVSRSYFGVKGYYSEHYEEGEEAAVEREIDRQKLNELRAWSARTQLINLAGGRSFEKNPVVGDRSIRRYILRWGFLEDAAVAGDERAANLQVLGLSEIGFIRLSHLEDVANAGREVGLDGLSLDGDLLVRAANKMRICGGNIDILVKLPGILDDKEGEVSFAVPGYIPSEVVTILVGDSGIGKSTLVHDLALLVGTKPEDRPADMTWLGVAADRIAYGTAVFLSGEEPRKWLEARAIALRPNGGDIDCIELSLDGGDPNSLLESVRSIPDLVLLVVDPARSFLTDGKGGPGNEDKSDDVDPFLAKVAKIAAEKRCAVLVLHHIKKGARPGSPQDVVEALRGSGAFKARPRSCIGMLRRRDVVTIAVAKHNVPPPTVMKTEPAKFYSTSGTLRLLPLQGDGASSPSAPALVPDGFVSRIVAAVERAAARGIDLRFSGKRGIFESNLPELIDIPRKAVREATQRAISSGAIVRDEAGRLLPVDPPAPVAAVAGADLGNVATRSTANEMQANQ